MMNGRLLGIIFLGILISLRAPAQQKKPGLLNIEPLPDAVTGRTVTHTRYIPSPDSGFIVVRNITVTGNKKTRTPIILRELGIQPGDSLYRDNLRGFLEEKRQQILNTSLFLTVEVRLEHPEAPESDLTVSVTERWYLFPFPVFSLADRNFNVWWVEQHHRLDRINYGVHLHQYNLTGRNDNLTLTVQNGYTHSYGLTYDLPYFDKQLKQGLGLRLLYDQSREVNFVTDSNKQEYLKADHFVKKEFVAGIYYTYKKAIRLKHQLSLNYHYLSADDSVLQLNPVFFPEARSPQQFLELSYKFSYIGADSWAYPLKGFNLFATLTRRGFGLFGGHIGETELQLNTAEYLNPYPKTYLSFGLRGRVQTPSRQPYFIRRSGMGYYEDYLRGLEYYVADADYYGIFKTNLKREVLAFRVRSRLLPRQFSTIPVRIYVKTYADLGYAHNNMPGNSVLNNRLLYTWGVGLDIVTFYDLRFRIEYSFNQLGEKGLFLHTKSEL
ncbi:POTRA domain-containing protein [Compostibacter hankyongensis]|uniref:POTRA domain-containing protein n=1 Tax=Compostibacter hankyongensis TaxID=1007089 RepID=A0ABP8FTG9_9BACT